MAEIEATGAARQQAFADRFAEVLRQKRSDLGTTIDRLVQDADVDPATAQAFEAGAGPIADRSKVQAIALSYDVDMTTIYPKHQPVEIGHDWVGVEQARVHTDSPSMAPMLDAFVRLIRSLRGNPNGPVVGFRRVDIDVLAAHFGVRGEVIVEGLGAVVGVTQMRQASMDHAYQSGEPTIRSGLADATV